MKWSDAVYIFSAYIRSVVKKELCQTAIRQKMQLTAPGYLYEFDCPVHYCLMQ